MAYFDILIRFVNEQDRSLSGNPETARDFVELEQIPFEKPDPSKFESWYSENIGDSSTASWAEMNNAFSVFQSDDCTGGFLTVEIHAHKSRSDLPYRMTTSKGLWKSTVPTIETEQKKESINVANKIDHVFSKENVSSIICAEWEGDVFDQFDELILPKPQISVSTNNPNDELDESVRLVFGKKCSGTIRVVKEIEYDVWILLIEPRLLFDGAGSTSNQGTVLIYGNTDISDPAGVELPITTGVDGDPCTGYYESNDLGDAYASSVRATWNGGHNDLEVTVLKEQLSNNCDPNGGVFGLKPGSTTVVGSDEDGKCYDLYVTRDKCTNEILSEELRQVDCDEE